MALAFDGDGVHRSGCSGDAVAFSKALVVVATTFGLGHDIRTHIQAHTHVPVSLACKQLHQCLFRH